MTGAAMKGIRTGRWTFGRIAPPLLAALSLSCSPPEGQASRRVELREAGPHAVKLVPAAGQLPFCLVFTAAERGVVRQLTLPDDGLAIPCPAGEPIGHVTYRIPSQEGKVRIYVVFADQPIKAGAIAPQIREHATEGRTLTGMDLRAPGAVQLETLEFTP